MNISRTAHRLRRGLVVLAVAAALPAALGTAQAAAYTGGDTDLTSTEFDGTATLAPDLAPAPEGEPDALTDIIRVDLVTPAGCTYGDKKYSHGSIVKMDGGELRECTNGSWVPYKPPPKT